MSEVAVTADCGCTHDEATGLPIKPCEAHAQQRLENSLDSLDGKLAGFIEKHDRLLAAALPAADRLKRAHNNNHAGLLVTCAMPACIELRALFSAIRECWPADQEQGEMP